MHQEPFSGSGPDGEEPDGPAPLPGAGNGEQDHPDRDETPPEEQLQGLYICLPAGQADLPGFIDGTATDPIAPGPLLAEGVTAIAGGDGAGLAEISEDCLFSVLSAGRRMSSWGTWLELTAMHQLAVRHPATQNHRAGKNRPPAPERSATPGSPAQDPPAAQDRPAAQDVPAAKDPAAAAPGKP